MSFKQYLVKHIQDSLILAILLAVVVVNYFIYAKLAFLDLFYLMVVLAGYYIGKRFAVLGAFFAFLMVWVFILSNQESYFTAGNELDAHINLSVWGGFLILAAWLIGSLAEKLRSQLEESERLRDDLHHERELLNSTNRQLREYSARLEEKVAERTRELQKKNQELMDFAFTASHDLQEPLRKIAVFGDRLEERVPREDAKALDYLERMRKSARRMQSFIQDLLKLSQVSVGSAQPLKPVKMEALALEVIDDLEPRITQSRGTVILDSLPILEADETQMRQLLQNLIGNALKYHREGLPPRVEVSSRPLRDGFWEIMVQDNGIGIAPSQIHKIFQPFQRANEATLFEGNGIGLAICKKIIDRHGGTIHAISLPNEGTTMILTLPESRDGIPSRPPQPSGLTTV